SEIAGFGECGDKLGRISALTIERAPIFAGELGAQCTHAGAYIGKFILGCALFHKSSSLVMLGTRVRPSAGPSTSLLPGIHVFSYASCKDVDGGGAGGARTKKKDTHVSNHIIGAR